MRSFVHSNKLPKDWETINQFVDFSSSDSKPRQSKGARGSDLDVAKSAAFYFSLMH